MRSDRTRVGGPRGEYALIAPPRRAAIVALALALALGCMGETGRERFGRMAVERAEAALDQQQYVSALALLDAARLIRNELGGALTSRFDAAFEGATLGQFADSLAVTDAGGFADTATASTLAQRRGRLYPSRSLAAFDGAVIAAASAIDLDAIARRASYSAVDWWLAEHAAAIGQREAGVASWLSQHFDAGSSGEDVLAFDRDGASAVLARAQAVADSVVWLLDWLASVGDRLASGEATDVAGLFAAYGRATAAWLTLHVEAFALAPGADNAIVRIEHYFFACRDIDAALAAEGAAGPGAASIVDSFAPAIERALMGMIDRAFVSEAWHLLDLLGTASVAASRSVAVTPEAGHQPTSPRAALVAVGERTARRLFVVDRALAEDIAARGHIPAMRDLKRDVERRDAKVAESDEHLTWMRDTERRLAGRPMPVRVVVSCDPSWMSAIPGRDRLPDLEHAVAGFANDLLERHGYARRRDAALMLTVEASDRPDRVVTPPGLDGVHGSGSILSAFAVLEWLPSDQWPADHTLPTEVAAYLDERPDAWLEDFGAASDADAIDWDSLDRPDRQSAEIALWRQAATTLTRRMARVRITPAHAVVPLYDVEAGAIFVQRPEEPLGPVIWIEPLEMVSAPGGRTLPPLSIDIVDDTGDIERVWIGQSFRDELGRSFELAAIGSDGRVAFWPPSGDRVWIDAQTITPTTFVAYPF